MAQRRMFSPEIVGSEEFKTMPMSSQALYFHLGMDADDDGFIQPKLLMRAIGFTDDDLKVLLAKRFLLEFGNGVVVIKHWLIHNMIRSDRYKPTRYLEEKNSLFIKENKAYTDKKPLGLHSGNQMAPQVRLGKDRLEITADADFFIVREDAEEGERKPRKTDKAANAEYEDGLQWAEERSNRKFINRVKQYAALKKAKQAGISVPRLVERWKELENEPFYKEHGLDWGMVLSSFDKKI